MSGKSKEQKVSIVEKMGLFMVCAGNIPLMAEMFSGPMDEGQAEMLNTALSQF